MQTRRRLTLVVVGLVLASVVALGIAIKWRLDTLERFRDESRVVDADVKTLLRGARADAAALIDSFDDREFASTLHEQGPIWTGRVNTSAQLRDRVRSLVPRDADPAHGWRAAAFLGVAYLLALRLVYLGQIELIPQEAYYWNYSRHLDIGYLDHPPLTAWLIALATSLNGSEFFVRLPALVSWCVMALYATLYARDLGGRAVALRTALLASALPFFFLAGWLMTPGRALGDEFGQKLRAALGEEAAPV